MQFAPTTFFRLAIIAVALFEVTACTSSSAPATNTDDIAKQRNNDQEDVVKHGAYLVLAAGCNDCHTPKKMSPQGLVLDTALTLSGHAANVPLPPIAPTAGKPGDWILMAPDITAFVGPWGTSYAANLTPDSATGIGAWTEEVFIKTLQTGRHLGAANGRAILPPMPWPALAQLKETDLQAIYAYLRSLPPISNKVPPPAPLQTVAINTKKM